MISKVKSIRPFIGAKDFNRSRSFYRDLGFVEKELGADMSLFKTGDFGFYLQDAYVKDWNDNTMVFLEVENVEAYWKELQNLAITVKYPEVKLVPIQTLDWGKECFVHDPSGILWHFGEFK